MNEQTIIDSILGLLAFLGGYLINSLKDSVRDMNKSYTELTSKVQSIEVLVAGNYVKKDDFEKMCTRIFTKLDSIDDKLDRKVDRSDCAPKHS